MSATIINEFYLLRKQVMIEI